ncbi:hypothetical protein P3T16_003265 [Paraburkholderia sp. GAS42]|jgi:hypothetical protein
MGSSRAARIRGRPVTGATMQIVVVTERWSHETCRWLVMTCALRDVTVYRGEFKERVMYNIVWLVGAVVIVLFVLGYVGLR